MNSLNLASRYPDTPGQSKRGIEQLHVLSALVLETPIAGL